MLVNVELDVSGIRGLHFNVLLISNGTAKMKLAILVFFYYSEFAKNSIAGNICTNLYFL